MDQQPRLFRLAPDAISFTARYEHPGWHLSVAVHVPGEEASDAYRARYEMLSTAELFDVIDSEAAKVLGFL
jgi:hypothetical protein